MVTSKVAWTEGVLLLPQHFQQLDRYHEGLVSTRLHAVEPASWGVLSVDVDRLALQQGLVSLARFEGILPDGTPLAFDATSATSAPKPRPVADLFPAAQRSLPVYLGLPVERSGVRNYGGDGELLRYALVQQKLADASRDDRHAELSLAMPNLVLLLGDEPRSGYTTLQVAEIVRTGAGELTLSERFVPPCLRVAASPVLRERLERLVRTAIARLRTLSEARRVTGEGRVEFTAADVTRYLQLHALNGMLPALHYVLRSPDVGPRAAFLLLAQFAGQLASFVPEADMTEPVDFDFGDLSTTFGDLLDLCERLLAKGDTERFVSCLLSPREGGRLYADLRDVRLERCERFLLAVESDLPRPVLVQEIVQRGKVASHGDMEFVLTKNIGGVLLRESGEPPAVLPVKPGLVYFDLPEPESDVYFRHVRQDRNLVVWIPPTLDPQRVVVKLVGIFGSRH